MDRFTECEYQDAIKENEFGVKSIMKQNEGIAIETLEGVKFYTTLDDEGWSFIVGEDKNKEKYATLQSLLINKSSLYAQRFNDRLNEKIFEKLISKN